MVGTHEAQFFPSLYKRSLPAASVQMPQPDHSAFQVPETAAPANADAAATAAASSDSSSSLPLSSAQIDARNQQLSQIVETDGSRAMWQYYDQGATEQIRFDRILADVPCSGDGTLRKSPELWSKWNTRFGAGLHKYVRS